MPLSLWTASTRRPGTPRPHRRANRDVERIVEAKDATTMRWRATRSTPPCTRSTPRGSAAGSFARALDGDRRAVPDRPSVSHARTADSERLTFDEDEHSTASTIALSWPRRVGATRAPQRALHGERRDDARPSTVYSTGSRAGAGRRARTERDPARTHDIGQGTVIAAGQLIDSGRRELPRLGEHVDRRARGRASRRSRPAPGSSDGRPESATTRAKEREPQAARATHKHGRCGDRRASEHRRGRSRNYEAQEAPHPDRAGARRRIR